MVGHEPAVGSGLEAEIETRMNVFTMGRVAGAQSCSMAVKKSREPVRCHHEDNLPTW